MTTQDRTTPAAGALLRRGRRRRPLETVIEGLLVLAAMVSIAATVGIIVSLVGPTVEFFRGVSLVEFLTSLDWSPTIEPRHFGVIPLVVATLEATLIAVVVAVPLGLGSAIYLSEYASPRTRAAVKPTLEILAGIPTVVYGAIAVYALNPLLRGLPGGDELKFQNLIVAGIVMGIMIIPMVASLSEDSMAAVPRSLREGGYALGSSKMQVATRVVVPAALSGIVASFVLGISRALGETMIVTLAGGIKIGEVDGDPRNPFATMTAFIANIASGDIPVDSLDYKSVFAVGALLFLITFAVNALSIRLVRKYREVYE